METFLKIENIKLWSRVGVLEDERKLGQLFSLDIFGIAASGGSACSSGSTKGSHVLAEIPLLENFQTVRFSLCRYNTIEEVDYTLDKIKSIVLKGK